MRILLISYVIIDFFFLFLKRRIEISSAGFASSGRRILTMPCFPLDSTPHCTKSCCKSAWQQHQNLTAPREPLAGSAHWKGLAPWQALCLEMLLANLSIGWLIYLFLYSEQSCLLWPPQGLCVWFPKHTHGKGRDRLQQQAEVLRVSTAPGLFFQVDFIRGMRGFYAHP